MNGKKTGAQILIEQLMRLAANFATTASGFTSVREAVESVQEFNKQIVEQLTKLGDMIRNHHLSYKEAQAKVEANAIIIKETLDDLAEDAKENTKILTSIDGKIENKNTAEGGVDARVTDMQAQRDLFRKWVMVLAIALSTVSIAAILTLAAIKGVKVITP